MFVDLVKISVAAGAGGNGSASFRREKFVPLGGPDGGDGGRGGSVQFIASYNENTLLGFRYNRRYRAEDGGAGRGGNRHGKNGQDLIIEVPVGTMIFDAGSDALLADLDSEGEGAIIARGGKGGRGNVRFANAVNRAPKAAELGLPGEELELRLELKLVADVGLIGFPNVGKSTILASVTAAKPKIADFPFTTLTPNLGVVANAAGQSFVLADIPGLIEGASEGKGLGHQFLRHIERTRLLIHVIDISQLSGRNPIQDWQAVNDELAGFNTRLAELTQLVALNKTDLLAGADIIDEFRSKVDAEIFPISAATGQGLRELMLRAGELLIGLPRVPLATKTPAVLNLTPEEGIIIERVHDYFVLRGRRVEILAAKTDFGNDDAVRNFYRMLKRMGAFQQLRAAGIKAGDTVVVTNQEFTYE